MTSNNYDNIKNKADNISINNLFNILLSDTSFKKWICKNITETNTCCGLINISAENLKQYYKKYLLQTL